MLTPGYVEDPRPSFCDGFGRVSEVTSENSLELSSEMLKKWLVVCKHAVCAESPNSSKLPKRLLDLEGEAVRLIEITEASVLSHYMTLSHC